MRRGRFAVCTDRTLKASWFRRSSAIPLRQPGRGCRRIRHCDGAGRLDLSGWELVLYNGSKWPPLWHSDAVRRPHDFGGGLGESTGSLVASRTTRGHCLVSPPTAGVVDFVAYEAGVLAVTGKASGHLPGYCRLQKATAPRSGTSLQRIGLPGDWILDQRTGDTGDREPRIEGLSGSAAVTGGERRGCCGCLHVSPGCHSRSGVEFRWRDGRRIG